MENASEGTKDKDISYDHRFQRTDQWMPVYKWLESLDTDELVKSKDVADWLAANPDIRDQLCSRHSRYHLMHYIKKCHMKILKRKEKKKGISLTDEVASAKSCKSVDTNQPFSIDSTGHAGTNLTGLPKDSDVYKAKYQEALSKFQILVEFEKQLLKVLPN